MNQRDETGLRVPIGDSITATRKVLVEAEWLASDPLASDAERNSSREVAFFMRRELSDLIRRRDAGETHEVMF